MNTPLNLVDRILNLGRRYQEVGRSRDAVRVLGQLLEFRELPAVVVEEAHGRLGELFLKRRLFRRARRHLALALTHQPDDAHYHYLMATVLRAQDRDDLEPAAEHYRRSLELAPKQVKCLGEYGLVLVRLGRTEEGLQCLREAIDLALNDADALARLAKGLRLAGRPDEARGVLQTALFGNPRSARFLDLWRNDRFRQVVREQAQARREKERTTRGEDEPAILPFIRISHEDAEGKPTTLVRPDGPATLSPNHLPRPARRRVQ